jgi:hypothetical protein
MATDPLPPHGTSPSGSSGSSGVPTPEEVDALVVESRSAVNKLGVQALWRSVLGMRQWYFVGAANDPADPEAIEPVVALVDGAPRLLAFTDEARAEAFAAKRAREKGVEPVVLHMEVPDALDYGNSLIQARVAGYLFNSGAHAFQGSFEDVFNAWKRRREG